MIRTELTGFLFLEALEEANEEADFVLVNAELLYNVEQVVVAEAGIHHDQALHLAARLLACRLFRVRMPQLVVTHAKEWT